jgi:hypothetical protein
MSKEPPKWVDEFADEIGADRDRMRQWYENRPRDLELAWIGTPPKKKEDK